MTSVKLKWRVDPAPEGPYKSFQRRRWPTATHPSGKMAAMIACADDYVPANARAGTHSELVIHIAQYGTVGPGFRWRRLRMRAATLDEAKAIAHNFFTVHLDWIK